MWKRAHVHVMQVIVGYEPPTCPWRAYYDPLVREVMEIWWAEESGNMAAVLGQDPVGVLVDALGVFKRAIEATIAEDRKIQEADVKRKLEERRTRQR